MLDDFYFTFVNQLIPIFLRMQLRGVAVDQMVRHRLRDKYVTDRDLAVSRLAEFTLKMAHDRIHSQSKNLSAEELSEALAKAEPRRIMGPKTISPQGLMAFLYDDLKLPVQWKRDKKTGESRRTADKKAMEVLAAKVNDDQRPYFADVTEVRELGVAISTFLDSELDKDGRFRWSTNIAGTTEGRISTSESPWNSGCVPADTEVLTPLGWIPISLLPSSTIVAQWNMSSQSIHFTAATKIEKEWEGELIESRGKRHRHAYTPDHRVPYRFSLRPYKVGLAAELTKYANIQLPTAGFMREGAAHNPALLRAVVMIQADGRFCNAAQMAKGTTIEVKKARKIARIQTLAKDLGWKLSEHATRENCKRYYFSSADTSELETLLGWPNKTFSTASLLAFDIESRRAFIDELAYWDGGMRGDSIVYRTTDENCVGAVMAVAACSGWTATCSKEEKGEDSSSFGRKPVYRVNLTPVCHISEHKANWKPLPYNGKVYCLTTETGFFVARRNGTVVITGNSNIQNWPEDVREMCVADPGTAFISLDGEQADARVVAWLSQDPGLIAALSDPDIHFYVKTANGMFGTDIIRNDQYDELAAFKETKSYKLTKSSVHGAHYGEGPRKFALMARIKEAEGKAVLQRYHNLYPGIRSGFQGGVQTQIGASRTLTNPFGRRRQFFARWGDDLFRMAYAHAAASVVADWLDMGLLRLVRFSRGQFEPDDPTSSLAPYLTLKQENLRFVKSLDEMHIDIEPAIQMHDGLLSQVALKDLARAVPIVREALTYEIPFPVGPLIIPVDLKVGTVWKGMRKATTERIEQLQREAA